MSGRNSFGPSRCSSKPWLSADGPNRPLGSIAVLNLPPVIRLVLIVEVADVRDVVMISGPLDRCLPRSGWDGNPGSEESSLILGFERRQDVAKKSWHYLPPIGTMLLRIGCLTRFNYPVGL
jgi:hypothetical protein